VGIALFINPRSRANRRHPERVHELAKAVGRAGGRVISTPSLDALHKEAILVAQEPPQAIAIHGGDGTVHAVISALIPAFGKRPLPPLALLTGGTMNVVPRSLALDFAPNKFLDDLSDRIINGLPLEIVNRHCLRIGDRYGFVFGNGFVAGFLHEYYGAGNAYGPGRALWIGLRTVLSDVVGGEYAERTLRPFRGSVKVDDQILPHELYTAITAGTVAEVGLGMKLIHRADEDIDKFNCVVIHAPAIELLADLAPVRQGKGLSPSRADSYLCKTLTMAPSGGDMPYTIDGDMYVARAPLEIRLGPQLGLLKPPDLPVERQEGTMAISR
jgi:diacylglycerol kinase family enzyme